MSSWASINRILFVSSRMPIKREYYPIASNIGRVNHFTVDTKVILLTSLTSIYLQGV